MQLILTQICVIDYLQHLRLKKYIRWSLKNKRQEPTQWNGLPAGLAVAFISIEYKLIKVLLKPGN